MFHNQTEGRKTGADEADVSLNTRHASHAELIPGHVQGIRKVDKVTESQNAHDGVTRRGTKETMSSR